MTLDRASALSHQLAQVHLRLRERLTDLRGQVAAGGGPVQLADLREHCLAFCGAVRDHHEGEDDAVLPALRRDFPDLAPVVDNLVEDHGLVAGVITRLGEIAAAAAGGDDPRPALVRELDGLAAILDSHFAYEERRIATALDRLGTAVADRRVFTIPPV